MYSVDINFRIGIQTNECATYLFNEPFGRSTSLKHFKDVVIELLLGALILPVVFTGLHLVLDDIFVHELHNIRPALLGVLGLGCESEQ